MNEQKTHPSSLFVTALGALLFVICTSLAIKAIPSNLDPTFGTLGKVVSTPDGTGQTSGNVMALQPDGKIVMLGNRVVSGAYAGMIIARYNADGTLDTNFGTNGFSTVTFGAFYEFGASIALQTDGKIVIVGTIRLNSSGNPMHELAVARFNTDGTPDTTFDTDGKLTINFDDTMGGFYHEYASVVKVAPDQKILVAGQAINGGVENRFVFARINPNGTMDSTFGTNGKKNDVTGGSSNYDTIYDMVILNDGKFVVVGFTFSVSFFNSRKAIKYTVDGVREWTYTSGAQVSGINEYLRGIAALPDGKFIIVGKRAGKIFIMRLKSDGTEDPQFPDQVALPSGEARSVAVHSNGKIVTATSLGGSSFSVMRFAANGLLDTSFGTNGVVNTNLSGGADYSNQILIQPDQKVLVCGSSTVGDPPRYFFAMARYMGESEITPSTTPLFDYDGDGRADVSVFRPSENKWYILRSSDSIVSQQVFAIAGDVPVPADYDGDGKTDRAIYRPSNGAWWYLSSINNAQINVNWGGEPGDIPRPSDFDDDGKTDFVFFRPTNNFWYRINSSGTISNVQFGLAGDKPVRGDFDGDGKGDVAIYRPSTGDWWYMSSINGAQLAVRWGISTDIPAPADFDGDGKTDFAVYRPSTGVWYIINSTNGSFTIGAFGISEDKPIPADYDGDGKADIAVFRPSTGIWYLLRSTSGFGATQWGISTDIPTENSFVP